VTMTGRIDTKIKDLYGRMLAAEEVDVDRYRNELDVLPSRQLRSTWRAVAGDLDGIFEMNNPWPHQV
jgi:hypothetical protein